MSLLFGFNYRVANLNWVFETYIDKKRKQFKILCQKTCTIWHGLQILQNRLLKKNFLIPNLTTFTNARLKYKCQIQNPYSKFTNSFTRLILDQLYQPGNKVQCIFLYSFTMEKCTKSFYHSNTEIQGQCISNGNLFLTN